MGTGRGGGDDAMSKPRHRNREDLFRATSTGWSELSLPGRVVRPTLPRVHGTVQFPREGEMESVGARRSCQTVAPPRQARWERVTEIGSCCVRAADDAAISVHMYTCLPWAACQGVSPASNSLAPPISLLFSRLRFSCPRSSFVQSFYLVPAGFSFLFRPGDRFA